MFTGYSSLSSVVVLWLMLGYFYFSYLIRMVVFFNRLCFSTGYVFQPVVFFNRLRFSTGYVFQRVMFFNRLCFSTGYVFQPVMFFNRLGFSTGYVFQPVSLSYRAILYCKHYGIPEWAKHLVTENVVRA